MATIKSFTDLEQSKKLAEILPLGSADMHWFNEYTFLSYSQAAKDLYDTTIDSYLPCWSLAALLSVLDFPSLTKNKEDEWAVCVFDHDNDNYIEKTAGNPIDACYELILKLHELNLL